MDLFALGVSLFVMCTRTYPFSLAHPMDPYYQFIVNNRADLFWKKHEQNLIDKGINLTKEFKSLITQILQLNPAMRPTLADVMAHPWVMGKTATKDEATNEMKRRLDELENYNKEKIGTARKTKEAATLNLLEIDSKANEKSQPISESPFEIRKLATYTTSL